MVLELVHSSVMRCRQAALTSLGVLLLLCDCTSDRDSEEQNLAGSLDRTLAEHTFIANDLLAMKEKHAALQAQLDRFTPPDAARLVALAGGAATVSAPVSRGTYDEVTVSARGDRANAVGFLEAVLGGSRAVGVSQLVFSPGAWSATLLIVKLRPQMPVRPTRVPSGGTCWSSCQARRSHIAATLEALEHVDQVIGPLAELPRLRKRVDDAEYAHAPLMDERALPALRKLAEADWLDSAISRLQFARPGFTFAGDAALAGRCSQVMGSLGTCTWDGRAVFFSLPKLAKAPPP